MNGPANRRAAAAPPRRRKVAALVAVLAVAGLVAGCARVVDGSGSPRARAATGATPSFPRQSAAAPSGSSSASGSATASASAQPSGSIPTAANIACPTVIDTVAKIRFTCLATGMTSEPLDGYSANVILQTESAPEWYMSQSSLPIKASSVASLGDAMGDALDQFVADFYPPDSQPSVDGPAKQVTVDGQPALLITGAITIDKTDPDYKDLKATKDRLVAIGVVRGGGAGAMLVMAVPDTNQDLWPKMDAVATSAHLV